MCWTKQGLTILIYPDSFFMHSRRLWMHNSDRQLTPNFELWVESFCVPTCFHYQYGDSVIIVSVCPSVCPYPKKRNHPRYVNISPTLVIDTSMERSSRVHITAWKPNFWFFLKGQNWIWCVFQLLLKSWNHISFVNISRILEIDTSMETQRFEFLFKKSSKLYFDLCWRAEITLVSSISVIHTWIESLLDFSMLRSQKFNFF